MEVEKPTSNQIEDNRNENEKKEPANDEKKEIAEIVNEEIEQEVEEEEEEEEIYINNKPLDKKQSKSDIKHFLSLFFFPFHFFLSSS